MARFEKYFICLISDQNLAIRRPNILDLPYESLCDTLRNDDTVAD